MTSPSVHRWLRLLAEHVGMLSHEIAGLHAELTDFCAGHGVDPDTILVTWLDYPELTVRRRHDTSIPPIRAVESFLIHNGVNIFGDIVCVPGRREDLVMQGAMFVPAGISSPSQADD